MSSSAEDILDLNLRTIWEEMSGSMQPSFDDCQVFVKAIRNSDHESVEFLLKNWCRNVSDIEDFLSLINFIQSIMKENCGEDAVTIDGNRLAIFKGIWQTFYSAVARFLTNPPDSSFGELIAAATGVTDAVERCLSVVFPGIQSCQTENNLCANFAEIWSRLANTVRLNAKLVNSLPWRDIQVCLTQKLVGLWTYSQSDEILHAFLTSQLRFQESLPVNKQVLKEWSALQSNKEDFERNFEACMATSDTAKSVEKNLTNVLNNFKCILEDFDHQAPSVKNKPKGSNKDKVYGQLEMMNDIQSLRRVLHFLNLARSFKYDPEDTNSGFMHILLIERVLQVTGESIKNTAGSPNLSAKKRRALEKAKVPLETLSGLRNALSHYNCFTVERKQHVENVIHVQSVLHELAKLEDVFVKALHRIEFTLLLELVREQAQLYEKGSAEAQFLVSLGGCESFWQIDEKMRGRISDDSIRQLHFLIQQFTIQSKVCKMEALFSSINIIDDKQENVGDIWQELSVEKREITKSTISEISEMKNVEELLQGLSIPTGNVKSFEGMKSSNKDTHASGGDFLDKFIDAVAHKYMSREFYANVARELFLGADFPVNPVVVETLLETYGDAEFATEEDRLHALSALRLLDAVLYLKSNSNQSLKGKQNKETLDYLADLVANAHFQPVTERNIDYVCENIGIDDIGINLVMRVILQDMFESILDETDHDIYVIIEKVINMCCSEKSMEQVQQTKEDAALKAARLKLIAHLKDIASKKNGTLSEEEFNSCKAIVNDALTLAKAVNVQSLFKCSNGRVRESDLKLLKKMASPFENLCKSLKETKSLEDGVKAFKDFLTNIDMSPDEQSAALSCFRSIQQDSLESYVVLRIEQLKKLLEKYNIPIVTESSSDSCAAYKCNHFLRAAIEMLLLECYEILDNLYMNPSCQTGSQCCNFTLCGTISSTDLRNYLAHGNSLLESYDSEIFHHVLQNAVELIINGKCIMALRKLFEDASIYSFIIRAEMKDELHTVHVGTISALSKRDVQTTVDMLQSNPNWANTVKRYVLALADSQKSILCKQTNMFDSNLTLSLKLMAEDALNFMLRNHLNQFSILVRANPEICKHLFRNSWTLLHYATSLKHNAIKAIDILLKLEVDVNASDDRNLTPLHLAVLFKSKDGVENLLSCKNTYVDAQNVDGVTPLHIAALQGSHDIVRLLLSSKAKINVQTHNKWSALHFAVNYSNKSIVELLLQDRANPNIIGEHKWTPLHLATHQNQVDIMEILINHSADPYAILADHPYHASRGVIHLAASYGSPEALQLLLDKGVAVDLKCPVFKYGLERNSLHWAASYGMEENVKFLLSYPTVDKDRKDDRGCTAIDYAMICRHASLVNLLLQYDCKPNLKSIIDFAAQGDLKMLQLLHEKGADLDISIDAFLVMTPAIVAAIFGRLDVLKFLLHTVHPDINALMHNSCVFGCRTVVQYLIEEKHYPDPSRQFQGMQEAPLHTAAIFGHLALVRYLVDDLGLNIDFSDGDGNTACMLAAQRRMWAVVKYCLKHGADVSGERGNRMARIAAYNEQWILAQEIFEKGASLDMHWEGSELDENMAVVVTAACKGNLTMLEYLIEKQCLDMQALPLQPLLILLETYAKQNALHYLVTKGLEMASGFDENGACGLHRASFAGNVNACAFFLDDLNLPIDKVDANGCSALHYAIRGRRSRVVKYLLNRNANASTKCFKGQSPLMLALEVGIFEIIDLLAQQEELLSKEMPDEEGNSFLMLVVRSVQDDLPLKKITPWLDHASTNIFHRNVKGETVLHSAAQIRSSLYTLLQILNKVKSFSSDSAFADFLNSKDKNGNSPLMLVVMTESDNKIVKSIEMLLKYNPDLNVQNCNKKTVLHLSLQRNNYEVLMALLEPMVWLLEQPDKPVINLADPRLRDGNKLTPLELAQQLENKNFSERLQIYESQYKLYVLKDKEEHAKLEAAKAAYHAFLVNGCPYFNREVIHDIQLAKSLMENNPSFPCMRFFPGNLPIHFAAEDGSVDVLKYFISVGSDVNAVNDFGQTALHMAASNGNVPTFDYLIGTLGLGCNVFDKEGNKPVHSAARSGKVNVLHYLFEKGLSDVKDLDENGETCLQIAFAAGSNKVIEYLLTKYDADASPLGNCELLNKAVFHGNLSTVKLLVGFGTLADIMKAGLSGKQSPLYLAIKNEYWTIAKFLLESATQNQLKFLLDGKGPDLLTFAAGYCQLDVLKLLVEKTGLDPNTPVEKGQTPLMSACWLGKTEVVEYLLSKNASPNAFNHQTKKTALHQAAKFGRMEAARMLIDHHADILAEDYDHDTPVHTAIEFGKWDVAVFILVNVGRAAKELFENLSLLHQDELKRHAKDKGIAFEFLS